MPASPLEGRQQSAEQLRQLVDACHLEQPAQRRRLDEDLRLALAHLEHGLARFRRASYRHRLDDDGQRRLAQITALEGVVGQADDPGVTERCECLQTVARRHAAQQTEAPDEDGVMLGRTVLAEMARDE